MSKYFIILLLLPFQAIFSQCTFYKLYNNPGGENYYDSGFGVSQTLDGGYLSVGRSFTYDATGSYSYFFAVKINFKGDTIWQKSIKFSTEGGSDGNAIHQLPDSSYIICGTVYDSLEHGANAFLLKLSKSGNLVWFKHVNGGYNDRGETLRQDKDGGYLIGGYSTSTDFNTSIVHLLKTDSLGNLLWRKQYTGPTGFYTLRAFDVAADGGFVLSGSVRDSLSGNPFMFLIKTDSAGNYKWKNFFAGGGGRVITTLDGGFAIAGSRMLNVDYSTGQFVKTDSAGNIQWQRDYYKPGIDNYCMKMVQLPDSSYIVGGTTFDLFPSDQYARLWLLKLKPGGDTIWTKKYSYYGISPGYAQVSMDYFQDIKKTSDGGIIMCGYVVNTERPSANELFLLKTDSMGNTCYIDPYTWEGCSQMYNTHNITGTLKYNNAQSTLLRFCKVYLWQNNIIIDSTTTTNYGRYSFHNIPNGTYTITASTTRPWNNVTATDALLIQRYIASMSSFTPLRFYAADINRSNTLNSSDVFLLKQRVVGITHSFPYSDWCFNPQPVTVSNSDMVMNFFGLCYGDVNGSYIPTYAKLCRTVELLSQETIETGKGTNIEIPVTITGDLAISAMSLFFTFPNADIEILSVNAINTEITGIVSHTENGKLNIVWNRIQPVALHAGEVLFTISAKIVTRSETEIKFELLAESEFADEEAQIIDGVSLEIPIIQVGTTSNINSEKYLNTGFKIIPNPAKDKVRVVTNETNAELTIFNSQGVLVFEKSIMKETEIEVADWKSGVYVVKVKTEKSIFVGKMVKE